MRRGTVNRHVPVYGNPQGGVGMNMGYGIPAAVLLVAAVLALSAVPAVYGDDCIDSVNNDGVVDDAEAERIIAELQASEADAEGGMPEVCLYSFGCPTLTVPWELFSAVQMCGAGMSVETRHGTVAFGPGSTDGMLFPDGTDVHVTVDGTDPYVFYEESVGDGLVTYVGMDVSGDPAMSEAVVSVLFELDDRHSPDDLEVYYLHGDRVCSERLDGVQCTEGCEGVTVTFDADRAGQYAVVYKDDSGQGEINVFASVAVIGFLLAFLAGVAWWVRRM